MTADFSALYRLLRLHYKVWHKFRCREAFRVFNQFLWQKKAEDANILRLCLPIKRRVQTQPVGLGRPPYLVIGFMGPVLHCLNRSFWLAPMYLENLRIGGTTEYSS